MTTQIPFKKRFTVLSAAFVACFGLSTAAFAQTSGGTTPSGNGNSNAVVAAINTLGLKMQAIATAKSQAANRIKFQANPNLSTISSLNQTASTLPNDVQTAATNVTANTMASTMQEISDALYTGSKNSAETKLIDARVSQRNTLENALTLGTPASDTPFTGVSGASAYTQMLNGYSVTQPKTLYNNYFNFGSLITPTAYTPSEQTAVNHYLQYLTQNYNSVTTDTGLSSFASAMQGKSAKTTATTLYNLINSSAFKSYQLTLRSLLASRSVGLTNLESLAQERMPILSKSKNAQLAAVTTAIGLPTPTQQTYSIPDPNNPGQTITEKLWTYASPLQISNYITNHRIDNPQWYQQMSNASPATVQRATLYVLAEIESQMQRQHLDNEKMIAIMSAMQLQNSTEMQTLLKSQASALKSEVTSLTTPSTSNTNTNTSSSSSDTGSSS